MVPLKKKKNFRRRQNLGLAFGFLLLLLAVGFLSSSEGEGYQNYHGDLNVGHENLKCEECHVKAKGTIRQQLQGKIRFFFGWRKKDVIFGSKKVTNKDCLDCHDRPNDNHPVFRFMEPKFKKARQKISPQKCNSCHQEHRGRIVTIKNNFCLHCHKDLKLKKDPLKISHGQLIQNKKWKTCLQCHDYHGNHIRKVPHLRKKAIPLSQILDYFDGGKDPYSLKKKHKSLKTRKSKSK